jgi:hypothetical protein
MVMDDVPQARAGFVVAFTRQERASERDSEVMSARASC